jgi:hypothetical protein
MTYTSFRVERRADGVYVQADRDGERAVSARIDPRAAIQQIAAAAGLSVEVTGGEDPVEPVTSPAEPSKPSVPGPLMPDEPEKVEAPSEDAPAEAPAEAPAKSAVRPAIGRGKARAAVADG